MNRDPYRNSARIYDRLFDRMNRGLKLVGMRMYRPYKGMSILDVGCGTGTHLELYRRYQCNLFGIDSSAAMLRVARSRLGDSARLISGNAAYMPYPDEYFDLVIAMLSLHEMPLDIRLKVLQEVRRVLKKDGHVLFIDYRAGPYQPLQGWLAKTIILFAEVAAGLPHYKNYRNFMKSGGLFSLISQHRYIVEKQQILAGGTFGIYLAK